MSNIIKPKRSSVAGKVPTTSDIVSGEIAINSTDLKFYTNNGTSVVQIGAGVLSSLGDTTITTPSANQTLLYNGTKWVNNTSTGTGNSVLSNTPSLSHCVILDYEDYTTTTSPAYAAGRLWYDSTQNALAYYNDVTNNTIHIGQEIQLKVYNNSGSQINIGQPVYVTSTSSGYSYPNVALAIANSLTTGNVIGLANQNIPNGTAGYVTTIGLIQGLNTGSYTVGDTLYLSPYSAGYYQNTIPPTGYAIKIGIVAYVNSSTGAIYVNKSNLSVQAGNIVGTVAIANGGTGQTTANAAFNALAPSQTSNSGKYLTSDGTNTAWAFPSLSTKTSAYTLTNTDSTILGNATSAGFTLTLPTAVGNTGKTYVIKKTDSSTNAVNIGTTSSQTIDGNTTYAISNQWGGVTLQSDGSNWLIIGNIFGRNGTTGTF